MWQDQINFKRQEKDVTQGLIQDWLDVDRMKKWLMVRRGRFWIIALQKGRKCVAGKWKKS